VVAIATGTAPQSTVLVSSSAWVLLSLLRLDTSKNPVPDIGLEKKRKKIKKVSQAIVHSSHQEQNTTPSVTLFLFSDNLKRVIKVEPSRLTIFRNPQSSASQLTLSPASVRLYLALSRVNRFHDPC